MKKFTELFVFLLFAFLLLCTVAFAEPKSFVSEGKYVLGCLDSQKDAKALGAIDAKKQAVDEAIKYLEGLPDVKAAKLTKDQVRTLATLMVSVEVLSDDWKKSGEISSVIIQIRSTLDASNIKDKIAKMREDDQTETIKEMQSQLASMQKELAELQVKQQQQITLQKKNPAQMEVPDIKKSISNEQKQKYEKVLKNVFALDYLDKGFMALADQRWNDAQNVFGKAIELNPSLADAHTGMSYTLYNLKQPQKALAFVNTALKINERSARSLGIKALILKDQPGKISQALASVNNAVKIKADNSRLYRIRGEIYAKMGKPILARKDFAAACKMGANESCKKIKTLRQKS